MGRLETRRGALALVATCGLLTLLGCSTRSSSLQAQAQTTTGRSDRAVATRSPASSSSSALTAPVQTSRQSVLTEQLEVAWNEGQARQLAGDLDGAFSRLDDGLRDALQSGRLADDRDALDEYLVKVHELAQLTAVEDREDVTERPAYAEATPWMGSLQQEQTWNETEMASRIVESAAPRRPDPPTPAPVQHVPDWIAKVTGPETLPNRSHPAVDAMIRFYTGRAKGRLELGLRRAGLYGPTVVQILEEEGVPTDIFWLALVESNFNAQAYSRARAKGLFQFIPSTGRRYGMDIDFWRDERADFEKCARASARYLTYLHGLFGDWHLAMAAYNAGEGKVGRGLKRTGRHDYWHLRRTRHIRPETKNYVPAMLAVMTIVRDPARYGIDFDPAPALDWEVAVIEGSTELSVIAECAGTTLENIKNLNPELRRGCTPGQGRYRLRVPAGSKSTFLARHAALPAEKRLSWHRHAVRKGETLGVIAKRYGSSVAGIMAANNIKNANRIGVGWKLLIPSGSQGLSSSRIASARPSGTRSSTKSTGSSSRSQKATYHTVRKGETLSAIAKRHGTSVSRIARANGIKNTRTIRPGQRLKLTGVSSSSKRSGSSATTKTTHRVRKGETLSTIAKRHGTTATKIARANGIKDVRKLQPGQRLSITTRSTSSKSGTKSTSSKSSSKAKTAKTHRVARGDTLVAIGKRHGVSVAQLRAWNGLSRKGLIHPGQTLKLTGPTNKKKTHVVKRGDTLTAIAKSFRTSVSQLREWNDLSRSGLIRPGDRLTIFTRE